MGRVINIEETIAKAERKGRSQAEVDQIICWLTGHDADSLQRQLDGAVTVEQFFNQAPAREATPVLEDFREGQA